MKISSADENAVQVNSHTLQLEKSNATAIADYSVAVPLTDPAI